jgi:hypothetical protein
LLSAYRIYRYDILRWREEEGMGQTIMAAIPPPGAVVTAPPEDAEVAAGTEADTRVVSR